MRPRGNPPPSVMSSVSEPDEIIGMLGRSPYSPSGMIAPLPNCYSMSVMTCLSAFDFSFASMWILRRAPPERRGRTSPRTLGMVHLAGRRAAAGGASGRGLRVGPAHRGRSPIEEPHLDRLRDVRGRHLRAALKVRDRA